MSTGLDSAFVTYNKADQRTKDIVNGYIRNVQQLLFDSMASNPYYNIPMLVNQLSVLYYLQKLAFKEYHEETMTLSDDKLTVCTLNANIGRSCFLDAVIDASKFTKVAFSMDKITNMKIGVEKKDKASVTHPYFENRLNSNGQRCDGGKLTGTSVPHHYQTGDIMTLIIDKGKMKMLRNDAVAYEWSCKLKGEYKLAIGFHGKDEQVSIHEVFAINQ